MIREINRNILSLQRKSQEATRADAQVLSDLSDTLRANLDRCVGMAANMIGEHKRVIAVAMGMGALVMVNPVITRKEKPYETEEGCLSLDGTRKTTRWSVIDVEWLDEDFKPRRETFSGFTAQIIQHEIDHCDGILI